MIPAFDISGVLPPYLGPNPALSAIRSPYKSDILDLVQRFASSKERVAILHGLLDYREALATAGFVEGFQWLDGSFVEKIESTESRPPGDIDVVTFFRRPLQHRQITDWLPFWPSIAHLFNSSLSKANYHCDAYAVDLDTPSSGIVNQTGYWFGLFSHKRVSHQWKGMIEISLSAGQQDTDARNYLNGIKLTP